MKNDEFLPCPIPRRWTKPAAALLGLLLLNAASLVAQNVGIGTSNPQEKLHVGGNLRVDPLAGADSRLVAADDFGTLMTLGSGTAGQVLVQGPTGPVWQTNPAWSTTGNAGTTPATHFVGTTDAEGLAFRTDGLERMRLTPTGLLCVNGTGPYASDRFSVYAAGNNYAVNGYASGSGDAGYFYHSGTGAALTAQAAGLSGAAATFYSTAAGPSSSPTVYAYNGSSTAPLLQLRTDVANPAAHGINLELNGASSQRGIQVDMDAVTTGVGVAVLQYGNNHALALQSFNTANPVTALLADHAGTGRSVSARTYLTTHTSQTALFVQSSNGLVTPTYVNAAALWAQSDGIRGGAMLTYGPTASNTCFQALYQGPAGNYDGVGVFGVFQSNPSYGYGVIGQGNWYGVFANGNSGASGVKSFMIDHPQDPAHKLLRHFSIESPEVLNVYRGRATLDAQGSSEVALPSYFHAINAEFTYHLTPIGQSASLFVASEIDAQGRFLISGGHPGQVVSWIVYARRDDPFVRQNPESITVEPLKRPDDTGLYLHPELYGQPREKGLFERNKVRPADVKPEQPLPVPAPSAEQGMPTKVMR